MTEPTASWGTVDWGRALFAGLVATVAMTVTMALFGMNFVRVLGMMLAPTATPTAQYFAGGIVHLFTGLFYAVLYAMFFASVRSWSRAVRGVVYGLAITAIALVTMPIMASMMGAGAANPCAARATANNPCNPCAGKEGAGAENPCTPRNPCNPCGPKEAMNPCNPCAPKASSNPCNPCSPSGGAGSPYGGAVSLINHLTYGLVLAFLYKGRTVSSI